ncbi:hypothetical protein [Sinobaca sp. H24]|nr:hypothetical protein [Sinobaca sp. H24]
MAYPDLSEEELADYQLKEKNVEEQSYTLNTYKDAFSPETFEILKN